MNLRRLKQAEQAFLRRYPSGFDNPEIAAIRRKRHNVDRMIAFTQESFAKGNFRHPNQILENMTRVIGRSSVISVFEKAKFRDFALSMPQDYKRLLASAVEELLHGIEPVGFEAVLDLLQAQELGKWSLMTICQTYYHPERDVLVKPNTVKNIIQHFELVDLQYKPTPSWDFYESYRSAIHLMKSQVDPALSPTNAAFSWFLLLSTRGFYPTQST